MKLSISLVVNRETDAQSCFQPLNLQTGWSVIGLREYKPLKKIKKSTNPLSQLPSTAEIRSTAKAAVYCGNSWAFWRENRTWIEAVTGISLLFHRNEQMR